MNKVRIKISTILIVSIVWWAVFVCLSLLQFNPFEILNITGFLFLIIIPGLLTVLTLGLANLEFWAASAFVVAFSIFELMLTALLGNTFLPYIGFPHPFLPNILMTQVSVLFWVLIGINLYDGNKFEFNIPRYFIFKDFKNFCFATLSVLFVVLSIFGAIRLNNGASNILTMIMLGSMGLYFAVMLFNQDKFEENTILTGLYFIALALLLMTSLRGWYITGHDIQSEFKVFQLLKEDAVWNIAAYRDAYNACLSITILPSIFSFLLRIPDQYIYKLLFQIIFAFSVPVIYMTGRKWAGPRISLLGILYFIGFPTFFTDMPFLIRQETAFLFYGLMLYSIFAADLEIFTRRMLFILMGFGVIFSHYSTTYTVLMIFGLAVFFRPILIKLFERFEDSYLVKKSGLASLLAYNSHEKGKITMGMIFLLLAASFFWTSSITQTGGGLSKVINETVSAVQNGFGEGNRSIDINTLLSFSHPDQNQEMQGFIKNSIGKIRAQANPGIFYPEKSYSQYSFSALPQELVPLTGGAQWLINHGINIGKIMTLFGSILGKLIEVLAPLGMIHVLFKKKVVTYIDDEIYLISFFSFVFILMNIVLPVLSTEYGIFRAMQQAMFIIAPIIVLGSMSLGDILAKIIRHSKTAIIFATLMALVFFTYSTSFDRELIGGYSAVLHLSNYGTYYDNYLIHDVEVVGVEWITNIATANPENINGVRLSVQTDRYSRAKFASLTTLSTDNDIFPGVVRKSAYVFLNLANVTKQRAVAFYNGDPIAYAYPVKFLDENKNLIYDSNGARVYK